MSENKYTNRLHLLRKSFSMSKVDVCKRLSIDSKTLYNYERGITPIPSDKLIKFAELYKCSTDYILCFDRINEKKSE